jgi:large subunit ribosomal protein L30e
MTEALLELRKHVQVNNTVIGTDRTIKLINLGQIETVFVAENCSADVKEDLKRYCSDSKCEVVELPVPNEELGVLCKKPFSVSVVGVPKKEK